MASKMKIRASSTKDGFIEVKALMTHPMETGNRVDSKTGEKIPAHFIQDVIAEASGKTVYQALWSGGVSVNPYIAFRFTGASAGDTITLSWTDNQGESETAVAEIR